MFNKIRKFIANWIYHSSDENSQIINVQFEHIRLLQDSNINMIKMCTDMCNIIKDIYDSKPGVIGAGSPGCGTGTPTTSKIQKFIKETND